MRPWAITTFNILLGLHKYDNPWFYGSQGFEQRTASLVPQVLADKATREIVTGTSSAPCRLLWSGTVCESYTLSGTRK